MHDLWIIDDRYLGFSDKPKSDKPYQERTRVCCIVRNEQKHIALIELTKFHHHFLPWGKKEESETDEQAIRREISEETGYRIENIIPFAQITHHKARTQQHEICYVYTMKTAWRPWPVQLTQKEQDQWLQVKWVDIQHAIQLLQQDAPTSYNGHFYLASSLNVLTYLLQLDEEDSKHS